MVAGGDPRRGKVIGVYLRDQYTVPHPGVVVVVAGKHCVDGGPSSGGRWFRQSWVSLEGVVKMKLRRGLDLR